jgi:hypothetical protein
MAGFENKTPRKQLLEAMAAGDAIKPHGSLPDPDTESFHPAEDFALAWLKYWRAIGNHVIAGERGYGFMCATLAGLNDEVPQPDLPPHLRLWTDEMRSGAERAMEVLLRSVPGARDALRNIVCGRLQ